MDLTERIDESIFSLPALPALWACPVDVLCLPFGWLKKISDFFQINSNFNP